MHIYIIYAYIKKKIIIYLFIHTNLHKKTSHFHCVPKVAQNNSSPAAAKAGIRRSELRAPPTSRLCGPCQWRICKFWGAQKHPKPMGYCWITMVNTY